MPNASHPRYSSEDVHVPFGINFEEKCLDDAPRAGTNTKATDDDDTGTYRKDTEDNDT